MRLFHAFSFLHLPKWIAAVVLAILLCPFATQAEEIEKSAKTELKDSGFQFELPVRLKAADKGIDDLWLERYQVYQSSEKVTELEAKHAKLQKRRNKFLRPVGDVEIAKQSFSDWINSLGKKKPSAADITYDTCHGYVWLVLRK